MKEQDQTKRDQLARDLFLRAIEIRSDDERIGFIHGACRDDHSLLSRVMALLQSHEEDSFMELSAVPELTTIDDASLSEEQTGNLVGRYKILQRIGEGGFGSVYMAEQKEPVKRRVALKIIKLGMDTKQVVARFEAERQALAMMDHPNIAKVLDAGSTDSGRPYFVMELVRGISITQYCDENNLEPSERLHLFLGVCAAIQHAHQKGIIHRDIKPSNVMVTLHDGEPVPKVIDFGIAKATQQELTEKTLFTQYSQFIGTPAYMSPEQAEMSGLDVDTRSDIYSLGVLLYELLTGRTPLDKRELLSGGHDEIRRRIREEEPTKPSTRVSTMEGSERTRVAKERNVEASKLCNLLKGDLDWVVMKALEKDRTRRYETANALRMDVQRYLDNEPVTAVAPSASYLLHKYIRRNKTVVGFAATIAFLLLASTTVSSILGYKAYRANLKTEESNRQLTRQVYQSLVADAQRFQSEGNPGYATQFWPAVKKAKTIIEEQAYSSTNNLHLRNMAIATLADANALPYNTKTHKALGTPKLSYLSGDRIAFGYNDGLISVHDVHSGKVFAQLRGAHQDPVCSIAYLSNISKWITADASQKVVLWADTKKASASEVEKEWTVDGINGPPVIMQAGLGFIVGEFGSQWIYYWPSITQTKPQKMKLPFPLEHQSYGDRFAFYQMGGDFLPDKHLLAMGFGSKAAIVVMDMSDQTSHTIPFKFHKQGSKYLRASFSPDGQYLMGASPNKLTVYRVQDWMEESSLSEYGSGNEISEFTKFDSDSKHVITGYADKSLWDFSKEVYSDDRFDNMRGEVFFSPQNDSFLSCYLTAYHWDRNWTTVERNEESRHWYRRLRLGFGQVLGASFSPDGTLLATSTNQAEGQGSVFLYELQSQMSIPLEESTHLNMPEDPTFSMDGRILSACNRSNQSILFWDTRTGKLIQETLVAHKPTLVTFHPHEPMMAMTAFGAIQLWNYELAIDEKGQTLSIKLNSIWEHDLGNLNAFSIRFSGAGTYMAWSDSPSPYGFGGDLHVMNYKNHERLPLSASDVPVYNGFDFVPDSSNISFFQTDQPFSKGVEWDPITNQHVMNTTSEHLSETTYSSVYRNHPHLPLAVVSSGPHQGIWRKHPHKDPELLCALPTLPKASIQSCSWSPDGHQLATCYADGYIGIWNINVMRQQLDKYGLDWE